MAEEIKYDPHHTEEVFIDEMGFLSPMESIEELTEKRIKKIESLIRQSFEYKNYITYIKEELDITQCALLEGIDIKDISGVSLELHHAPFTLFDIVEIITNKMFDDMPVGTTISNFDIAKQVMYEHYAGNVGLVPLTKTIHEAVHNGVIVIPASKIYGNYIKFMEKYKDQISIDKLESTRNLLRFSETSANKKSNDNLLQIDAIIIDTSIDD